MHINNPLLCELFAIFFCTFVQLSGQRLHMFKLTDYADHMAPVQLSVYYNLDSCTRL